MDIFYPAKKRYPRLYHNKGNTNIVEAVTSVELTASIQYNRESFNRTNKTPNSQRIPPVFKNSTTSKPLQHKGNLTIPIDSSEPTKKYYHYHKSNFHDGSEFDILNK